MSKKSDLIEKAKLFAKDAHESIGQTRKYTGEPYFVHPYEVARIVMDSGGDEAMICAAYLHDVVEDTPVTLKIIESEFGPDVASLVEMLTDISTPADGNRAARKAIDLAHTEQASPRAKTIKLADLISNTKSIVQHDPEFAKTYLSEKAKLMCVLTEGDAELWMIALQQIEI